MSDVTLIIPVYNAQTFLHECLESLKNQSITNLQIIFIADCPTDQSTDILRQFGANDLRVEIYVLEKNCGPAIARNFGLQKANGEYVRFVDSDDILPPDSTKLLYKIASTTGAELVRGNCMVFDDGYLENTYPMRNIKWVGDAGGLNYRDENYHGFPWCHPVFLYRREFLLKNNLRYPDLRRGEDPIFLLNALLAAKKAWTISDTVYLYRAYKEVGDRFKITSELTDYFKHYVQLKMVWLSENMSHEWRQYFDKTFWWFWNNFVASNKGTLLANYVSAHSLFKDLSDNDISSLKVVDRACVLAIRDSTYTEFVDYLNSSLIS